MTRRAILAAVLVAGLAAASRAVDDPAPPADPALPAPDTNGLLKGPPPAERKVEGLPDPAPAAPEPAAPAEAPAPPDAAPAEPTDAVVPEPFPLERYAKLWEKSPFHLESVAPPQESAGLSQQYALTGIAHVSGEPIVFLLERATQLRHMIDRNANTSGLSLVQVDVQSKYADSTATIRRGGEVGVIKFDLAAANTPQVPPGMPPGMPPGAMPGMPTPQIQAAIPGQPPRINTGVQAQLPPGVVPPVPNPAVPAVQAVPGQPDPNVPPPRVIRRRATVPAAP